MKDMLELAVNCSLLIILTSTYILQMMQFNIGLLIMESMRRVIKLDGKSFKRGFKGKAMVIFGRFSTKQPKKSVGMCWHLLETKF